MSINRKALLIGSSNVSPPLPGVEEDLKRYCYFLYSNNGGAWEKNEIIISLNESRTEILNKVRYINNSDFAFILIAGHGEYRLYNNNAYDEKSGTYYYITDTDAIHIKYLFPRVIKSIIITDVCRVKVYIDSLKKSLNERLFSRMDDGQLLDRSDYRRIYDNQIINSPQARMVLFSCGADQEAGDNGEGGVFSRALLNSYNVDNCGNVVSIKEAFDYAKNYVYENNYPQLPEMDSGRGRIFFPFAIT